MHLGSTESLEYASLSPREYFLKKKEYLGEIMIRDLAVQK